MISLDFLNKPHGKRLNSEIVPIGDIGQRLETFRMVTLGAGWLLPASIGKREAANHPPMHRTNPHNKELSDPKAANAQVDKHSLEMISIFKKEN